MPELTVVVRFVHLAASILALGILAFLCVIAHPAVQRAGAAARSRFARFERNQARLLAWAVAVIFVSGLVALILQTANMTGLPLTQAVSRDTLAAVFSTQYGQVWLVRHGLLLLLAGVCVVLANSEQRSAVFMYAGFALAAGQLAAVAFAGHAAAGEGMTLAVDLTADALHLLGAGTWLGALPPLALLLAWCRRSELVWAGTVAQEATRRFSWLGVVCVTTLVIAGSINAWNLVGGIPQLVGTSYGRLLLLKLGLLAPLLALAATNLLRLRPELLRSPPRMRSFVFGGLLAALQRNTVVELALGVAILTIVAMLGVTPPARHVQPEWPFAFRFDWDVTKTVHEKRTQTLIGAGVAALALLPFGYAAVSRRRRRWVWGAGFVLAGSGAALALPALWIDAYPTTYRRPAVPYQAISVASGLQVYQQRCIVCHGIAGYGDGPGLSGVTWQRADLTAKHTGDHTAGDLFWWLSYGIKDKPMPGFRDQLTEEARWDVINFLRTLAAAEQARPMAPLIEPAWLVAPDFAYQTLSGRNKNLKEHRGQNVVLLVLFTLPQSQPRLQQLSDLQDQLAGAAVEVLAVPRDVGIGYERLRAAPFSTITNGAEEVFGTYGVFRRSLSEDGMRPDAPLPPHMEFLIDRQGYIRARWIAAENAGWTNAEILLGEIAQLNREKPSAPAPDDHVH